MSAPALTPLAAAGPPAGAVDGDVRPQAPEPGLLRDLMTLGKPGITIMCLIMAAGAYALGVEVFAPGVFVAMLAGTGLSVMSANAFNMIIERDGDRYMARTRSRPLAAGRMGLPVAFAFAGLTGVAAVVVLLLWTNPLTAGLAMAAHVLYVGVYTPAKRRTTQALAIGAVPGAMPPLVGWAAATGSIGAPGLVLFLVLALWQLPHFLAISIYRRADYEQAGILVVPAVRGEAAARMQAFVYSFLMVPASLLLVLIGTAGFLYFVVASVLGAWFLFLSLQGLEPDSDDSWARKFFLASLVYLPALTLGLVLDRLFFQGY